MRYLKLDYTFGMPKPEIYENVDEKLTLLDLKLFENEKRYIKKCKFNIIKIVDDYGYIIIENTNKIIPYKKINPNINLCSKNGFPCFACNDQCKSFNNCKYKKYPLPEFPYF